MPKLLGGLRQLRVKCGRALALFAEVPAGFVALTTEGVQLTGVLTQRLFGFLHTRLLLFELLGDIVAGRPGAEQLGQLLTPDQGDPMGLGGPLRRHGERS